MDDPDGWRRSVTAETKALFAETIANPGGNVLDISLAAAVAHEVGAPLVVDNTFATPYLCRPLEFGADLVIHSATKFLVGQRDDDRGRRRRLGHLRLVERTLPVDRGSVDRVPRPQVPRDVRRLRAADEAALRDAARLRRRAGALQRVPAAARDGVARGADGPPRRERARGRRVAPRPAGRGRGAASRAAGQPVPPARRALPAAPAQARSSRSTSESGREGGRRFIEALSLWSHLANVGDTKSLVIHPASTTHRQLSDEELAASGVAPGTVRFSVGLEDVDDLTWDLARGLRAARGSAVTA